MTKLIIAPFKLSSGTASVDRALSEKQFAILPNVQQGAQDAVAPGRLVVNSEPRLVPQKAGFLEKLRAYIANEEPDIG